MFVEYFSECGTIRFGRFNVAGLDVEFNGSCGVWGVVSTIVIIIECFVNDAVDYGLGVSVVSKRLVKPVEFGGKYFVGAGCLKGSIDEAFDYGCFVVQEGMGGEVGIAAFVCGLNIN